MGEITRRTASIAFGFLVVVWGLNYLVVRWALADSPPLWLAFLRCASGAVPLVAFVYLRPRTTALSWKDRRDAAILGLPTTAIFFGLWFSAGGSVLPGLASVLVYT